MSSIAAVANLGVFAVTCDSLGTLFRRAVAVIAQEIQTGLAAVCASRDDGIHIVASHGDTMLPQTHVIQIDDGTPDAWGFVAVHAQELSGAQRDFLRAVATILGQAILRERAEELLQMRARQQSAIAELSRLVVNPITEITLTRACDLIIERVGVEHSLFFELDGDTQELRFRAGNRWFPDSLLTLPLTATSQGAECVMRNEPVIVDDYASDTRFASARSLLDWGVSSGVIVPVASSSGCVGILTANSREPRTFTDDDIHFIEALAHILGDALERDHARHDLAVSEDRYRDVVEAASDIIFTTSPDGRITSLNNAFERITGYAVSDWIGRSVLELGTNGKEMLNELSVIGATTYTSEISIDCPRGTVLLDLALTVKVRDTAVLAIHGFARDITEARQAERERQVLQEKLEQANRIAGLGRLAATIAHEFNNVLMGISPFIDVMRRGKNVETALEHIGRAVARGRRITQDILRFTQPAEPSRVNVDLETWLQTATEESQSLLTSAYEVAVKTSGEPLHVHADPAQLQQVFTNLILNARDAMPNGGNMTIELRRESPETKLRFALAEPERFAHLSVRDTGCGMNEEMLRHAFEPLFTTKRNGTGLGLPVALQVVERHGGELFVESAPGSGTAFHIFLPLTAPDVVRGPVEVARQPVLANARLVVLVEDDPIVAAGLIGLLTLEGMAVRLVKTGGEALDILRRIVPDLVILDVGLPDIDGTQVFTTLGSVLAQVPVIFSTGHADRTTIEHLLAAPNVGFLLKPYEHRELLEMMHEVMTAVRSTAAA